MPDWSYRTVFRPIFFRLPPALGRSLCLGVVGTLARLPLGGHVIDLLGHMRPDPRLRRDVLGLHFPSSIGLGAGVDVHLMALRALSRFGFGFLDVGPVTREPIPAVRGVERQVAQQALWYPDALANAGLDAMLRALTRAGRLPLPLLVRLAAPPDTPAERASEDCCAMARALSPHVPLVALATLANAAAEGWSIDRWSEHVSAVRQATAAALLVVVPADLDPGKAEELLRPALAEGVGGVLVSGDVIAEEGGRRLGRPAWESAERQVRHLRAIWGPGLTILGGGGVHEPAQALRLREAGADLIQIESGLVYSGPGLPKRINEALLHAALQSAPPVAETGRRPAQQRWFWTALLGAGMTLGSALALLIAATQVVLPYDEGFVGMSRAQLQEINPRLLAFMSHDRVTLAGTMVTIGVLYLVLSLFGVRRGLHWAAVAIFASAFSGFATFFLFLGFGYFDPFHAFVTAVLLQFLLLAVHADPAPPAPLPPPNLRDDWRWRLSLWGQLLFVIHGATLLVAGLVISAIGCTKVFVPEDLEFMGSTAEALTAANPRLVPMVAHDRATFGGMLISSGLLLLLSALWGYRQGARWLWWGFLASALPAYAAAIGVHLAVGYTNVRHLAPAFAGLALVAVALALSYPYLFDVEAARREWAAQTPNPAPTPADP
jgi:dihydroorotate dehydrogenase